MNSPRRRVKITGLGPVTPAGIGTADFFRGINEPVSRVREITRFDPLAGAFVGAEIVGFRLNDFVQGPNGKRLPRQTQFAMAAAILALADAGLEIADLHGSNPVVICGSSLMDPELTHRTIAGVAARGPRAAVPSVILDAPPSAVAGRVALLLKTPCRTAVLQTACCAGLDAVGHGADMIATGQANIAFCCGTEAPLQYHPMLELGVAGWSPRNARKPEEMGRPFDLWRNCGVIGEGACMILLESEESPREPYAWIEGYAYANDAVGPAGNGLKATMRMALANARRSVAEIDLIHAWGPGHTEIDRSEAMALCDIFGDRIAQIPAVSIKGAIGNPFAAAGSIQVASAALSLKTTRLPPTVNWETPDPECPLHLCQEARDIGFNLALVNAHGLSGTNSSMILSRP